MIFCCSCTAFTRWYHKGIITEAVMIFFGAWLDDAAEVVSAGIGCFLYFLGYEAAAPARGQPVIRGNLPILLACVTLASPSCIVIEPFYQTGKSTGRSWRMKSRPFTSSCTLIIAAIGRGGKGAYPSMTVTAALPILLY